MGAMADRGKYRADESCAVLPSFLAHRIPKGNATAAVMSGTAGMTNGPIATTARSVIVGWSLEKP